MGVVSNPCGRKLQAYCSVFPVCVCPQRPFRLVEDSRVGRRQCPSLTHRTSRRIRRRVVRSLSPQHTKHAYNTFLEIARLSSFSRSITPVVHRKARASSRGKFSCALRRGVQCDATASVGFGHKQRQGKPNPALSAMNSDLVRSGFSAHAHARRCVRMYLGPGVVLSPYATDLVRSGLSAHAHVCILAPTFLNRHTRTYKENIRRHVRIVYEVPVMFFYVLFFVIHLCTLLAAPPLQRFDMQYLFCVALRGHQRRTNTCWKLAGASERSTSVDLRMKG